MNQTFSQTHTHFILIIVKHRFVIEIIPQNACLHVLWFTLATYIKLYYGIHTTFICDFHSSSLILAKSSRYGHIIQWGLMINPVNSACQ